MKEKLFGLFLASTILVVGCSQESTEPESETNQQETETEELDNQETMDEETTNESTNENNDVKENTENTEEETFNEEEMREYIRSTASNPEEVDDRLLEQLELRGFHQNTLLYEGRMNPDLVAYYFLPDGEGDYEEQPHFIEPNSEGYFTLAFSPGEYSQNLDTTGNVQFVIALSDNDPVEARFYLPIHPSEEGMEVIQSHSASETTKEDLKSEIELDPLYPSTLIYDTEVNESFSEALYEFDGERYSAFVADFMNEENPLSRIKARFPEYPEVDQEITFYIPYRGYLLDIDQRVEALGSEGEGAAQEIRDNTVLPDSFLEEDLEGSGEPNGFVARGQTSPYSTRLSFHYGDEPVVREASIEEDGSFEMLLYPPMPQPGDQMVVTIKHQHGYTETFEVEVE